MDGIIPAPSLAAAGPATCPGAACSARRRCAGARRRRCRAAWPRARREGAAAVAPKPGTRVPAFLEIRPDGTVRLLSPFVEGGQGIATAMAQIVGEELDVDPARFVVECAPPGADYLVVNGIRMTGGSSPPAPPTGSCAGWRHRPRHAGSRRGAEWKVPEAELTTEAGRVLHGASGRSRGYGELAAAALALPPKETCRCATPQASAGSASRWRGSTSATSPPAAAVYGIDQRVDGHAAGRRAARAAGSAPSRAACQRGRGAGDAGGASIHRLPGAVAVLAESWWRARRAVEALQVPGRTARGGLPPISPRPGCWPRCGRSGRRRAGRKRGRCRRRRCRARRSGWRRSTTRPTWRMRSSSRPPRWRASTADGTLELWAPNQMPEMFQAAAAKVAGLEPAQVTLHSPLLGGFFGRHFLYDPANPFPQAILLAKARAGR